MSAIHRSLFLLGIFILSDALELTSNNWTASTEGKSVFVKFDSLRRPSKKSKEFKPIWDQLMEQWNTSKFAVVAEFNCDAKGNRRFCDNSDIHDYPALKFGQSDDLEEFPGNVNKTIKLLQKFAKTNLKPLCIVTKPRDCNKQELKLLKQLKKVTDADLASMVKQGDDTLKVISKWQLKEEMKLLGEERKLKRAKKAKDSDERKALDAQHTKLSEEGKAKIIDIKVTKGLRLMKQLVKARAEKAAAHAEAEKAAEVAKQAIEAAKLAADAAKAAMKKAKRAKTQEL